MHLLLPPTALPPPSHYRSPGPCLVLGRCHDLLRPSHQWHWYQYQCSHLQHVCIVRVVDVERGRLQKEVDCSEIAGRDKIAESGRLQ